MNWIQGEAGPVWLDETLTVLAWAAAVSYVLAFAGHAAKLMTQVSARVDGWLRGLVTVGLGSQGAVILTVWILEGAPPVVGYRDTLFFLGFATVFMMRLIERRHELTVLGAFVLPVATVSVCRAVTVARWGKSHLTPSAWLPIHAMGTLTGYALLVTAFGVGMAYLIQERQLKSKHLAGVFHRLPSLDQLDQLSLKLIAWATPLLIVGWFSGWMWTREIADPATNGRWQLKALWMVLTIALYVLYLGLRKILGWRGRSAVYVFLIGFFLTLVTYVGVNIFEGKHYF